MSAGDGDAVRAHAVRWLRTVRWTLLFCLLLVAVYFLEVLVWTTAGFETFVWLFVATSDPSPGWLLAALAHSPLSRWHLATSLGQLLVFGGMAERRLPTDRYLLFLGGAGLASTAGQVASYAITGPPPWAIGSLGASGTALAVTAFAAVHSLGRRTATGRWQAETTWVWATFGVAVLFAELLFAIAGGRPSVGGAAHLTGIAVGTGYGLVRSGGPRPLRIERSR